MFTDMVGYTALMQEDERRAKVQRDRQRAVLEGVVERRGGEILQFYGDGTLSVFSSAVEGVHAAIEIQREVAVDPAVPMRIGMHLGDVLQDEHGVLGDGVNVAARVQALATPGSVLVTSKIADELKNHPDLPLVSLGEVQLKHVSDPIEIFGLSSDGLDVPSATLLASVRPRTRSSVAVLPFANMSSDPENEFFADGITEEIINALTRVEGLQVTARTSSFAFKGAHHDIREIATRLGVNTILEGSVRRAGKRVRITAQLIDARDGYHLFSEVYDRSLDDIFDTQDEISHAIVRQLREHLDSAISPGAAERAAGDLQRHDPITLVPSHTHDAEAYTEYLKGRFYWNRWTPADASRAITHFERSAELDPSCALPFSGLAHTYTFLASTGQAPADDAYPRAAAFARHALELEPEAGEGHLALGAVRLFHEWDFDGARRSIEEAVRRLPGSAEPRHIHSLYLKAVGELDEAVAEMEIAVRLDPLSLPMNHALAVALLAAGRIGQAEMQTRRALELDSSFRPAIEANGFLHVHRGDYEGALGSWEELPKLAGDRFAGAALIGFALGRLGRDDEARETLALLDERAERFPDLNLRMDYALLHWGLDELDRTFHHLNAAIDERLGVVVFLATSPTWAPIRDEPRFQALIERVGIPTTTASALTS
ncbi:MAG: adenylate/guanylate cyclase domain-containing protein [Longimicrobiales bacterium]|nr:adenylate/guanylate cyclase domain-containing protein [Longimicrobiales bacterium]